MRVPFCCSSADQNDERYNYGPKKCTCPANSLGQRRGSPVADGGAGVAVIAAVEAQDLVFCRCADGPCGSRSSAPRRTPLLRPGGRPLIVGAAAHQRCVLRRQVA